MHTERPYCISVAGFDPSGGAGVLADIKVFECLKTNGLGVVSALTFQNDSEFDGVDWISLHGIENQIIPLAKYPVKVAKVGLVQNMKMLKWITYLLKTTFPNTYIIWDPVLKASAGFEFHKQLNTDEIANYIDLITPNYDEYEALSLSEINLQCAVLLKGGHRVVQKGTDILFYKNREYMIHGDTFENKADKHGTGCVLSSAIAAYLSKGENLISACKKAKQYVEKFILSNAGRIGYHSAN